MKRGLRAFTVMELIVVVVIIALLVAILLPSLSNARGQGRTAVCVSNLANIGRAAWTRRSDLSGNGQTTNSCGIMDMLPYLADARVYICPEDNFPLIGANGAVVATYSDQSLPHAYKGAKWLYDMPLSANTWIWETDISPTTYYLNYEDQQGHSGCDYSFYNFYLVVNAVGSSSAGNGTQVQYTSKIAAPAGDKTPPTCSQTGGPNTTIGGGYSFDLVSSGGLELIYNWTRGDSRVGTLSTAPDSYGMNALYPSSLSNDNVIIALDYLSYSANVAGANRDSSQWTNGLVTQTGGRVGFPRHRGLFNALYGDNSVRAGLMPNSYDPTTQAINRKKYWGE
jgi:type II secretory pathway pseudopilin PulG